MRIALVHDYLSQDGGAERVLKALHEIWPEAPIFVLFHDRQKIGYLNGDVTLLEKGIVTAIYQFRIERAYELKCKSIVLGGTPPFLENGVLKYKAKWQARFCSDMYFTENYLLINPQNRFCYEFLHANSLVVYGLKNTLIVLSSKKPEETKISGHILDDIKSWYLLREERIDNIKTDMEDLPVHLQNWYERIY